MSTRDRRLLLALGGILAGLALLVFAMATGGEPAGGAIDAVARPGGPQSPVVANQRALAPDPIEARTAVTAKSGRIEELHEPTPAGHHTGRIAGTVVLEDGSTRAPDVAVMITLGSVEPPPSRAAALLRAENSRSLVRTDDEGKFEFGQLDPGQSYSIVIGARGRIGAQPRWVVRPDRPPETYQMYRLFAARLRLSEPGGAPIRLNPGLQGQRLGRSLIETAGVFPLYGKSARAVLAGIEVAAVERVRVAERTVLFTSAETLDEISPIRFRADYPGYEAVEQRFRARFVPLGIPDFDFVLQPVARGFGSLLIEIHGWNGHCDVFENPGGPAALLRLQSKRGELMTFELPEMPGTRVEVDGLPYGTWRAVVMLGTRVSSPARRNDPAQTVEIGPSPARYDLDLANSASILLDVYSKDGELYRGQLSILYSLEKTSGRSWRSQHFLAAPYRMDELEPGSYKLVLQVPFKAGTAADRPRRVRAVGGDCTLVELREE